MAINLIKINDFPESIDTKNWMVVADSNGISYKISIDNIKAELGIGALMQYRGSVVPSSAVQPAGDFFVTATQSGTYTNYGGVVVPVNSFAVISRVGGVYASSITGLAVLKLNPIINISNTTEAVSGKAVADYNNNLFGIKTDWQGIDLDYTAFTNTGYINGSGGITAGALHHTNKIAIPEGVVSLIIHSAPQHSVAFYDASENFIETKGSVPTQNDWKVDLLPTYKYFIVNTTDSRLPGGSTFYTNPAYVRSVPFKVIEAENLLIKPDNIEGSTIVGGEFMNEGGNYFTDAPNTGYIDGSGTVVASETIFHTDPIPIPLGSTHVQIKYTGLRGVAYYDAGDVFITTDGNPAGQADFVSEIPQNATSVVYNALNSRAPHYIYFGIISNRYSLPWLSSSTSEYWTGKKIAWYGTSIPAGVPNESNRAVYSYANRAAALLGASIQNFAIGNGRIRASKVNGSSTGADDRSFTRLTSAINYKVSMLDLIGTPNEPDLFVFDYSINDFTVDPTDINDPESWDFTSEATNTFLGSYNFVIKQLLTAKPTARIMLVTHFSNDVYSNTPTSQGRFINLNDLIIAIARYWGFPVLEMCKLTGWINKNGVQNITDFAPDGVHPAGDPSLLSIKILTQLCFEKIKTIS